MRVSTSYAAGELRRQPQKLQETHLKLETEQVRIYIPFLLKPQRIDQKLEEKLALLLQPLTEATSQLHIIESVSEPDEIHPLVGTALLWWGVDFTPSPETAEQFARREIRR